MRGRLHRRRAGRPRRAAVPPNPANATLARRHWRPHSERGRASRESSPRLPANLVRIRDGRPPNRRRRAGRSHREAASSLAGSRCLDLLRSATAVGRCVIEQRPPRYCPTLAASAQRYVSELPHDGAAGRAATTRLGVHLCEEIVWKGDHDFCHEASIPRYTHRRAPPSVIEQENPLAVWQDGFVARGHVHAGCVWAGVVGDPIRRIHTVRPARDDRRAARQRGAMRSADEPQRPEGWRGTGVFVTAGGFRLKNLSISIGPDGELVAPTGVQPELRTGPRHVRSGDREAFEVARSTEGPLGIGFRKLRCGGLHESRNLGWSWPHRTSAVSEAVAVSALLANTESWIV